MPNIDPETDAPVESPDGEMLREIGLLQPSDLRDIALMEEASDAPNTALFFCLELLDNYATSINDSSEWVGGSITEEDRTLRQIFMATRMLRHLLGYQDDAEPDPNDGGNGLRYEGPAPLPGGPRSYMSSIEGN